MKAIIRAELDRLKESSKYGLLHFKPTIAVAKNKTNPLHTQFTWDKNKGFAMNLMREFQTLVAEYTVVVMHGDSAVKTRHFVSLTSDRRKGGGYRVITDVLNDEIMTRQLLADALAELASFQAKYRRLSQLAGVFTEIEKLQKTLPEAEKRPRKRPPPESRAVA